MTIRLWHARDHGRRAAHAVSDEQRTPSALGPTTLVGNVRVHHPISMLLGRQTQAALGRAAIERARDEARRDAMPHCAARLFVLRSARPISAVGPMQARQT